MAAGVRSPREGTEGTRGRLLVAALICVIAGAGLRLLHPWPRHGLDRIRHAVSWPDDCASVETVSPFANPDTKRWPTARTTGIVRCNDLGPAVGYAGFTSAAALSAALSQAPTDSATCVYGRAVALNYMDHRRDFVKLCDDLDGKLQL